MSKKKAVLECIALNANELHIPALSPEEGVEYISLWIAYLQQYTAGRSNIKERENQCLAIHMEAECTESGKKNSTTSLPNKSCATNGAN